MALMSISDAFFLLNESRATPMHVGGLNLYTLPKGVNETEYLATLRELFRQQTSLRPIFENVLKMTPLGTLGPINLKRDEALDLDYHVRFSAVPKPGRYRELFELVSRLHSSLLDRSRPLWEFHIISGLENRQFATYFKIHHSLTDGIGAVHTVNSMHSNSAKKRAKHSPFSLTAYEDYKKTLPKPSQQQRFNPLDVKLVAEALSEQLNTTVNLSKALLRHMSVWTGMGSGLAVPWHKIPRTSFSGKITGARRFVAQSYEFQRIREVGKAFDGTVNDAVLAMCSGALRKYLLNHGELPELPLKAMAPISLRAKGDTESANAVGFLTANLATHLADPADRMHAIQQSMRAAKKHLEGMSASQIRLYTLITQTPMVMTTLTGVSNIFPAFSTVVSNVPGFREQMYLNGAKLEGSYPASIPMHGTALNFTQVSNNSNMDFGVTACRKSVPHVQRLIEYLEDSLIELEEAV